MNIKSLALASTLALLTSVQAIPMRIASVSPLTGDLAPIGIEVKRGVELAVQNQVKAFKALGYELDMDAMDDEGMARNGTVIAQAISGGDLVYGVVGAVHAGVTQTLSQGLAASKIPVITPASSNDDLTAKGWKNVYRMVSNDTAESLAAVNYMAGPLGTKRVFVISDNSAYGNGLTRALQKALKAKKITVAGYIGASNATQIAAAVTKAKASKADLIYYGGTDDVGAPLLKALRAAGVNTTFMGGSGLDSPSFLKRAGIAAAGALYSTGFGPVSAFNGAQGFTEKYQAAYKAKPTGLALYSFDAANVLLEAMRASIQKNGGNWPTRAQVNEQMDKTNLPACFSSNAANCNLISGAVAFDSTGERMRSRVFIVKLSDVLQTQVVNIQNIKAEDLK